MLFISQNVALHAAYVHIKATFKLSLRMQADQGLSVWLGQGHDRTKFSGISLLEWNFSYIKSADPL